MTQERLVTLLAAPRWAELGPGAISGKAHLQSGAARCLILIIDDPPDQISCSELFFCSSFTPTNVKASNYLRWTELSVV